MREQLVNVGLFLALLASAGLVTAQTTPQNATLSVHGLAGQAPVFQVNGKSYVDIEALARLVSASLSFKGNEITLTLPASAPSVPTAPGPANQPESPQFSKDFLKAGIEEMSVIREWRSAIVNAVQNGYAVTDAFMADYQGQAATSLRLASVAIVTDADRKAYRLLSNEFDRMQQLSSRVLAARKNMNYIPTDALKDDPLDQTILNCARALAAMAASGQFVDDASCN
jgi:hypothetical protein